MKYTVYILHCADNTLYTGYTHHLKNRLALHNSGKGAKYTRSRTPVTVAYQEFFDTESDAKKREYAIKQLSRAQKLQLIADFFDKK